MNKKIKKGKGKREAHSPFSLVNGLAHCVRDERARFKTHIGAFDIGDSACVSPLQWRLQRKTHNAILIDGTDAERYAATGKSGAQCNLRIGRGITITRILHSDFGAHLIGIGIPNLQCTDVEGSFTLRNDALESDVGSVIDGVDDYLTELKLSYP